MKSIFKIVIGAAALSAPIYGCRSQQSNAVQGYLEADYVYISSPHGGALRNLAAKDGQHVDRGALLFELDPSPQDSGVNRAGAQLQAAQAALADAQKGKRPTEMEALEAEIVRAAAALKLSEAQYLRSEHLFRGKVVSQQDFDQARAARDQDRARVAQLQADSATARLGSRDDAIAAAEAKTREQAANVAEAEWNAAQKRQTAPAGGLVYDTLYREGEWVPAGRPVVVLLPPENIKLKAFVPEQRLASVQVGNKLTVSIDGRTPVEAIVSYISPQAEYTPPVLYTRDQRSKLVFLVEAKITDAAIARTLHPGQPVDVQF